MMGAARTAVLDRFFLPKMLEACRDEEERGLILVLYHTGMHGSRLASLTERSLRQFNGKTYIEWREARSGKIAWQLLPRNSLSDIAAFLRSQKKTIQGYNLRLRRLAKQTGFEKISTMSFRRTRAHLDTIDPRASGLKPNRIVRRDAPIENRLQEKARLAEKARKKVREIEQLKSKMPFLSASQKRMLDRWEPDYEGLVAFVEQYDFEREQARIERRRQAQRAWYRKHRNDPAFKAKARARRLRENPPVPERSWRSVKRRFLSIYGGKCACCGEKNPAFLTLDHVHNDGLEDYYDHNRDRLRMLLDVVEHPDYQRFQILCYNCNMGKAHNYGQCPHKGKRRKWPEE